MARAVGLCALVCALAACSDDDVAPGTDGGVGRDAGLNDGGVVGIDAVYVPPDAAIELGQVTLLSPPSGARSGSVHSINGPRNALRPSFRWTAVADARRYELELDDSCPSGPVASCTFPSPDLRLPFGGTTASLRQSLPVPATAPRVTRYAWRVRACALDYCGPYSAPRYLDVGMLGGDADGDGYEELIAGAPGVGDADRGAIVVWKNLFTAEPPPPFVLEGPGDGRGFGTQLAPLGDVDGDRFPDIAVATRGATAGALRRVFVLFGGTDPLSLARSVELSAPSSAAGFGAAVVGAGDLDADGLADVFVSAPGEGKVYFFAGTTTRSALGAHSAVLAPAGAQVSSELGAALAAGGDVNGDGALDLVVGAPGEAPGGAAYVVTGGDRTFEWVRVSPSTLPAGARFGAAVAGRADLTDDNFADLVIGAPGETSGEGAVYVLDGRAGFDGTETALRLVSPEPGADDGYATRIASLEGWFDFNRLGGIAVGAPNYDYGKESNVGGVVSYYLREGVIVPMGFLATFDQYFPETRLGSSFGVLDFNGDGYEDLALGVQRTIDGVDARELVIAYGADGPINGILFGMNTRAAAPSGVVALGDALGVGSTLD